MNVSLSRFFQRGDGFWMLMAQTGLQMLMPRHRLAGFLVIIHISSKRLVFVTSTGMRCGRELGSSCPTTRFLSWILPTADSFLIILWSKEQCLRMLLGGCLYSSQMLSHTCTRRVFCIGISSLTTLWWARTAMG
eukprot:2161153-Amphidinium_carterae.1